MHYLISIFKCDSKLQSGWISVPINEGERRVDGTLLQMTEPFYPTEQIIHRARIVLIFIHRFFIQSIFANVLHTLSGKC